MAHTRLRVRRCQARTVCKPRPRPHWCIQAGTWCSTPDAPASTSRRRTRNSRRVILCFHYRSPFRLDIPRTRCKLSTQANWCSPMCRPDTERNPRRQSVRSGSDRNFRRKSRARGASTSGKNALQDTPYNFRHKRCNSRAHNRRMCRSRL